MNKLILIGNGFDLAHGLKTSYGDFLLWYLNSIISKLRDNKQYSEEIVDITAPYTIRFNDDKPYISLDKLFQGKAKHHVSFNYKSKYIETIFEAYGIGNWVNIEYTYYRSLIHLLEGITHDPLNKTKSRFNAVKSINDSLHFLTLKLAEYLKSEVKGKAVRNPDISQILKEIVKIDDISHLQHSKNELSTLVLNFNYTNTIDLYDVELGYKTGRTKKINIHGEIDSMENPIIFGYGDEMDPYYRTLENLNMNSILDHIKSFHYLKTGNNSALTSFLDSGDPFTVYIMGHSCGISDRVLLNSIFEHKDCQKIKIYYYKRDDGSTDFFEKTQEISRHFKPGNKEVMRNKIVSLDKCTPLIQ